jgi:phosphatidate cytidylyltransferase
MSALMVGLLVVDQYLAPWYPFLFVAVVLLGVLGTYELRSLLPTATRPIAAVAYAGVVALAVANWSAAYLTEYPVLVRYHPDPWHWVWTVFVAFVIVVFLVEIARFDGPNGAVVRMGLTVLVVAYIGLLPSCLAQLRWRHGDLATWAIALTVFVPKVGDIGAYFTGKLIGRHRMTPVLSPKKTWEGFAGGMIASVVTAVALNRAGQLLAGDLVAVFFGLTVGAAGVFGDLAESLVKRDVQVKDAASSIPGFGGILDVIDSVLFAAPVAYLWLR